MLILFLASCKDINTREVKKHRLNEGMRFSGIPVIIINSNHEVNLLEKVICEIEISDSSIASNKPLIAKIKTRVGDFGSDNPKPSYSITLTEVASLLGMQADREWILNGSYIDKTFLRDKLVSDLFGKMDSIIYTAKSEFVNLYMNGEYLGLYLLTEKLNENRLKINTVDRYSVIFKEPEIFIKNSRIYNQKYPDPGVEDMSDYLFVIKQLLHQTSNDDFRENVNQIFDIYNLANWHLLLQLTNNHQGLYSSFYLYRKSKKDKFNITIWDYDGSFGRTWDGKLQTNDINIQQNILFKRLLEIHDSSYQNQIQEQWNYLRKKDIISLELLNNYIDTNVKLIGESLDENVKKYPVDGPLYFDSNNFQQEVDLLKQEIASRIQVLDSLYNFEPEQNNSELSD